MSCFDTFQLASGTSASCKRAQDKDKTVAKLAKTFAVNEADLRAQFVSVLPTAQALQRQAGLDNRSAWAEALTRLQKKSALRKKYPMDALLKVQTLVSKWRHEVFLHANTLILPSGSGDGRICRLDRIQLGLRADV